MLGAIQSDSVRPGRAEGRSPEGGMEDGGGVRRPLGEAGGGRVGDGEVRGNK